MNFDAISGVSSGLGSIGSGSDSKVSDQHTAKKNATDPNVTAYAGSFIGNILNGSKSPQSASAFMG